MRFKSCRVNIYEEARRAQQGINSLVGSNNERSAQAEQGRCLEFLKVFRPIIRQRLSPFLANHQNQLFASCLSIALRSQAPKFKAEAHLLSLQTSHQSRIALPAPQDPIAAGCIHALSGSSTKPSICVCSVGVRLLAVSNVIIPTFSSVSFLRAAPDAYWYHSFPSSRLGKC